MNATVREFQTNRSGSALLVVLGFLSFMVVSAVAFSIYMRSERAPSSALRRSVAMRHLVKAALAQAMSRVDDAVRADPFPGLPNTNNLAQCYKDRKNNPYNIWYGRVFMPPDPEGTTEPGQDVFDGLPATQFAPITETVSVLNLEALGYLPPPLVNDVRFLSRSTWTAKWQNFMYDAGRFAFCAVNVSDYFDINKVTAGPRSALPGGNISIAHLLRSQADDLSSVDAAAANQFAMMTGPKATGRQTDSGVGTTVPYVSLMDYNLALGSKYNGGLGGAIQSPFHWWLTQARSARFFNLKDNGEPANGGASRRVASQPFVTDSWTLQENTAGGTGGSGQQGIDVDISTIDGQPFPDLDMSGNATVDQVAQSTTFLTKLVSNGFFNEMDQFTLYDYLDHDDKPLMLAMPGVETAPMVAGVTAPIIPISLKINPTPAGKSETIEGEFKRTDEPFKIDSTSFPGAQLRALVAFPFAHTGDRDVSKFSAQAILKVFVAKGAVAIRSDAGIASVLRPVDRAAWADGTSSPCDGNRLLWTFCSARQSLSFNAPNRPADALKEVDFNFTAGASDVVFYTKITRIKVNPENPEVTIGDPIVSYKFNLRPLVDGANGAVDPSIDPNAEYSEDQVKQMLDPCQLHAAVWVRITDGTTTYDLAPASVSDDVLNNRNNGFAEMMGERFLGRGSSLLLFDEDGQGFTFKDAVTSPSSLSGAQPNWGSRQSLATVDPRYNYAAEDWYERPGTTISGDAWIQELTSAGFFSDDRDPDIFMFTSDQGYLQSLGELAFLPRLRDRQNSGVVLVNPSNAANTRPKQPGETANAACAWRTHLVDRQTYQDLATIGIGRIEKSEWKVNPYSDNDEVLLAAFANTPGDYWVTGRTAAGNPDGLSDEMKELVNELGDKSSTKINDLKESLEYAFCEKNAETTQQLKTEKVAALAKTVANVLRASAGAENGASWETAYDNMFNLDLENLDPTNPSTFEQFLGVQTDIPLWSTDRKFLYSYWRDCFANKQQLFLIFVRAESNALGGSGEGTPSQQSGRAVALVWREPQSNTTDGGNGTADDQNINYLENRRPHRMRVLFYHQFD